MYLKEFTKPVNFVFRDIAQELLMVVGLIAMLMFFFSGINYMISWGNPEKASKAKKTLYYAFLGLILTLISYALVGVAGQIAI